MSPSIWVALLPRLMDSLGDLSRSTAVVIDTLRFTTTACHALQAGAASIRIAATIEEARELADSLAPRPLLCGERHCHPIAGFDLGNSPFEYTSERVAQQSLLFTTTNGTLAVGAAQAAADILLAGFVNRAAVCQQIRSSGCQQVTIVCAGTDGQMALEDVLTAGAIVRGLHDSASQPAQRPSLGNDAAQLALAAWDSLASGRAIDAAELRNDIQATLSRALGGRNLLQAGFAHDVEFAAQVDVSPVVPQATASDRRLFCAGSPPLATRP